MKGARILLGWTLRILAVMTFLAAATFVLIGAAALLVHGTGGNFRINLGFFLGGLAYWAFAAFVWWTGGTFFPDPNEVSPEISWWGYPHLSRDASSKQP